MYVYPVLAVLNYQVDLMDGQWSEVKCLPAACITILDVLSRGLTNTLLIHHVPSDIHIPPVEIYDTGVLDRGVQQEVGGYGPLISRR